MTDTAKLIDFVQEFVALSPDIHYPPSDHEGDPIVSIDLTTWEAWQEDAAALLVTAAPVPTVEPVVEAVVPDEPEVTKPPVFKEIDPDPVQREGEKEIDFMRRTIRARYISGVILGKELDLNQTADFSGGGDSGDLYFDGDDEEVEKFFDKVLDTYITFDWYNDEGGGGDIAWDIHNDVITINGFSRYTETEPEMSEEEF